MFLIFVSNAVSILRIRWETFRLCCVAQKHDDLLETHLLPKIMKDFSLNPLLHDNNCIDFLLDHTAYIQYVSLRNSFRSSMSLRVFHGIGERRV